MQFKKHLWAKLGGHFREIIYLKSAIIQTCFAMFLSQCLKYVKKAQNWCLLRHTIWMLYTYHYNTFALQHKSQGSLSQVVNMLMKITSGAFRGQILHYLLMTHSKHEHDAHCLETSTHTHPIYTEFLNGKVERKTVLWN